MIFITDGFGPMPASPPGYPVLWLIPEHGVREVPFGSVIRLPARN